MLDEEYVLVEVYVLEAVKVGEWLAVYVLDEVYVLDAVLVGVPELEGAEEQSQGWNNRMRTADGNGRSSILLRPAGR